MRVISNPFVEDWERRPDEIQRFPEQMYASMESGVMAALGGATDGIDADRHAMPCGQGAGAIDDILSCREIIEKTIKEAMDVIGRIAPLAG
jgi:enoyl-[acyl-carrier protein] reductase II